MLRRTTGVTLCALLTGLITVVTSAPSHASTALGVPAGPLAGDVVVTATTTADPAYAQLQLRMSATPIAAGSLPKYVAMRKPNAASVEFTMPTWGLDDEDVTFSLFGCSTDQVASCTADLTGATELRHVEQTTAASATISKPDGLIFLPEEQVTVTALNEGGGALRAYHGGLILPLKIGETDVAPLLELHAGSGSIAVGRCNPLTQSWFFCEPLMPIEPVQYMRSVTVTGWQVPEKFGLNSEWLTASQSVRVNTHAMDLPYDLSWEIKDAQDQTVVGPVSAGNGLTAITTNVVVDPVNHLNGMLPDGDYHLVFNAVAHKGELIKTGASTHAVQLGANPPVEPSSLVSAQRLIRFGGVTPLSARFAVRAAADPFDARRLVITNSDGVDVSHQDFAQIMPCWQLANCPAGASYFFEIWPYADATGDGHPRLPGGTYTVRLELPDSWGRMSTLPLGKVYLQDDRIVSRYIRVTPRQVRVAAASSVGSCSSVSSPGPSGIAGSLALNSGRCGGAGSVVRQVFAVDVPWESDFDSLFGVHVQAGTATLRKTGRVRIACSFPTGPLMWRAAGWSLDTGIQNLCFRTPAEYEPLARERVRLRVVARDGARVELRSFRLRFEFFEWYTPR